MAGCAGVGASGAKAVALSAGALQHAVTVSSVARPRSDALTLYSA
ncbi:MAG: hypothetical protein ACT4R6_11820 [Gemmatimonadaceae bacterium]